MKTPMQEHLEWLDIQWGNAKDCGEKTIDFEIAIAHAESMLEKEKEVMESAWQDGMYECDGDGTFEDFYKTFNTKKK